MEEQAEGDLRSDLANPLVSGDIAMREEMISLTRGLIEFHDSKGVDTSRLERFLNALEALEPIDALGLFTAFAKAGNDVIIGGGK